MAADKPVPDLDAWIDAMMPVLGITLDPAFRPGVIQNLQVVLRLSAIVLEFPLDEREEPAPVFEP
jgi:hypothetical protein